MKKLWDFLGIFFIGALLSITLIANIASTTKTKKQFTELSLTQLEAKISTYSECIPKYINYVEPCIYSHGPDGTIYGEKWKCIRVWNYGMLECIWGEEEGVCAPIY